MARPRQVSDEEILEAARDCFLVDPNTSTATIAGRLGVSQAAIFKRFGTKMRLLLASVGVRHAPPWVELCEAGPDDRPIPDQLRELGLSVSGFFRMFVPRVAAMKALGVEFRRMFGECATPPPVVGYQALTAWFARAMADGRIRGGDPGATAIAFLGTFQARAFWAHVASDHFPTPLPDDEDYVDHVVQVFWRGLDPHDEARP